MAANDRNLPERVPQAVPLSAEARKPAPPPPGLSASPDVLALLKALQRRWFLACSLGLLAAGIVGAAAYFLLPAKFTAFALLQVSSRASAFTDRGTSREEFSIFMKTTAARLKSRDVLMRTLGQDQVRHLPMIKKHPDTLSTLTWLEEYLKVDNQDSSELLTVSLTGEEPGDLQTIVNNMVKSFMTIVSNEEKARRKDRLEKTKFLHESAKEKLAEKVNQKDALLKTQGVRDPYAMLNQLQNAQGELRQAQGDFLRYRLELEKKTAQLANAKAGKKTLDKLTIQDVPQREALEHDPRLQKDLDHVDKLEKLVERLVKEGHPPTDSTLRQIKEDLEKAKKKTDEAVAQARGDLLKKFRAKHEDEFDVVIGTLQTEVTPLEKFVAETRDRIEVLIKETERINISTKKYDVLDTEIVQEQKNTDRLFDVHKQAQMDEEAEPRITPIGEAELQNRDMKKRLAMLVLAPAVAFFLVLFTVAWWEFAARRIHEPEEVVAALAMRVVGAVPELPDPKRSAGADPAAEELVRHNLIESVDAIRTMLLRGAGADNLRVVMVTSAVGGEGKTTLASQLAMSLARAGRKTLLIDCDLRGPALHQMFEQPMQPGFSEVVLHEIDLPDAVRATPVDPNLYLLPAGLWDREVVHELAKPGITSIFEKLRDEFDFVIVDSHPVLAATDALLIGQHVDAVLVSLMRDVSQMHNVHAACQRFASLGIRVFGAVINGVPVKTFGRPYRSGEPTRASDRSAERTAAAN